MNKTGYNIKYTKETWIDAVLQKFPQNKETEIDLKDLPNLIGGGPSIDNANIKLYKYNP
jgi:hypothetical protein